MVVTDTLLQVDVKVNNMYFRKPENYILLFAGFFQNITYK
jgi:hypothetical protein